MRSNVVKRGVGFGGLLVVSAMAACGSSTSDAPAAAPRSGAPPACVTGAPGGAGGPSLQPRGDTAGALDASGSSFVVFGGDTAVPVCGGTPSHTHDGETWLLDVGCGAWRKVASAAAPQARARHAMAADAAGNRGLLFGGRTRTEAAGDYTVFNDTWAFDFASASWKEVATTGTPPSARSNTAAVVDAKGQALIVFGGSTSTSGLTYAPKNDTFALDLTTGAWRAIATSDPKPPARLFHAMAIDAEARAVYVFGGAGEDALTSPTFDADVWRLDLATETWAQVPSTGDAPGGRIDHALAFDTAKKRLVLFGGHDDGTIGNQNDLFELDLSADLGQWKRLAHGDQPGKDGTGACTFPADFTIIDKAAPERRNAFAFGARADGSGLIVVGGKSDCGLLGDAWWLDRTADRWTTVSASPVGLSCLRTQTTCTGLCG